MVGWKPLLVLPNLVVDSSFDSENIAIVPMSDSRVSDLCERIPKFDKFINSFRDNFNEKLTPALMIARDKLPDELINTESVAGFRDAISISSITSGHAITIIHPNSGRICFSDTFDLYPWSIDKSGERLVGSTLAMSALHRVELFSGQSSPNLPVMELSESRTDMTLMRALFMRWQIFFVSKKYSPSNKWNISLFRSLNMANSAAKIPSDTAVTVYDAGRCIALWVSALEILAHPYSNCSGFNEVRTLLEKTKWQNRSIGYRRYIIRRGGRQRVSLAIKLLDKLYQIRNDFIHGNRIKNNSMFLSDSKVHVFGFSACLYRVALANYLNLEFKSDFSDDMTSQEMADIISNAMDYDRPQKNIEKALLKSRRATK